MTAAKEVVGHHQVIRSYEELRCLADACIKKVYPFLILVGRPGIGKSYTIESRAKKLAPKRVVSLRGAVTPSHFYCECWRYKDKSILLDDAESLWNRKAGRVLLRALAETTEEKQLRWGVVTPDMRNENIPVSFVTKSTVCMVVNDIKVQAADEFEALKDRARIVLFEPDIFEIHRNVGAWFTDREIYDYFKSIFPLIGKRLTVRMYRACLDEKKNPEGSGWKMLADSFATGKAVEAMREIEKIINGSSKPTIEVANEFTERTGMATRTFYKYWKLANRSKRQREKGDAMNGVAEKQA